jgi:hypothetical protein
VVKMGTARPSPAHPRPDRVEDTRDPRVQPMRAMVGHGRGLGEALGLVFRRPRSHGVHVAPIVLRLGCSRGSPHASEVDARRKRAPFAQARPKSVVGAESFDFQGLDGKAKVVRGAGRRGEVEHGRNGPFTLMPLVTSVSTKWNRGLSKRPPTLRLLPVRRLSTQTTSTPSSRNRSDRCDPRKPAPPVMTTPLSCRHSPRFMQSVAVPRPWAGRRSHM